MRSLNSTERLPAMANQGSGRYPQEDPRYICFARWQEYEGSDWIGCPRRLPNVHAGGRDITLEIANLGPFTFGLREDDVIAQLVVAMISSSPAKSHNEAGSVTVEQEHVGGKDHLATELLDRHVGNSRI